MKNCNAARLTEVNNLLNAAPALLKAIKPSNMKNQKSNEVQNAGMPYHELHEQAEAAVTGYLKIANQSARTGSDLPGVVYTLLNDGGIAEIPSFIEALVDALQAMAGKASEPLKEKLGDYNFKVFVNLIGLLIKAMSTIQDNEANQAEIIARDLSYGYKSNPDITDRIYLNDVLRKYITLTENVTANHADWAVHDKIFE